MFLPITSTSELRYWPIATVALIVANILAYVVQHSLPTIPSEVTFDQAFELFEDEELTTIERLQLAAFLTRGRPGWWPYALSHGDGLNPVQWLTSMFMHAGLAHLIGNLIFLWVFGHIVEGVVGHSMMASLYVGLGVLGNAIEQIAFLAIPAVPSLGASGAIYTLMLLAAWFAPHDHIQGFVIAFYRFWLIEVPVLIMAGFYFLWDIASAMLLRFEMSTPLLHAIGGVVGLIAGFMLLRFGIVENEGRDALTQLRSLGGKDPEPIKLSRKPKHQLDKEKAELEAAQQAIATSINSLHMHAKAGNLEAATYQIRQLRRLDSRFQPNEETLVLLISAAQKQQRWNEVVSFSEQYLAHHTERAVAVRLVLANVFVHHLGMPIRALKTLKPLEGLTLDAKQLASAKKIHQMCLKELDDGSLEPSD